MEQIFMMVLYSYKSDLYRVKRKNTHMNYIQGFEDFENTVWSHFDENPPKIPHLYTLLRLESAEWGVSSSFF